MNPSIDPADAARRAVNALRGMSGKYVAKIRTGSADPSMPKWRNSQNLTDAYYQTDVPAGSWDALAGDRVQGTGYGPER